MLEASFGVFISEGGFFMKQRCQWADKSLILQEYHDNYWGKPVFSNQELFQNLSIQVLQSGLNFEVVLSKLSNILDAFDNFSVVKVSRYNEKDLQRLLHDGGIIKNERKIKAIIKNAKLIADMSANGESFSDFLWAQVDFVPVNIYQRWNSKMNLEHPVSGRICTELKKRGFDFIGPVNISFFLQASGIINAHWINCEYYRKRWVE